MSDTSSLSELAHFVSASQPDKGRLSASQRLAAAAGPLVGETRPGRRGVGDLLGVVLALSARTRRVVMPKVGIDLDVFSPDGRRAVRMMLPQRDRPPAN
jgi:hypothetical protein